MNTIYQLLRADRIDRLFMARTASITSPLLELMDSTEGENYYTGLRYVQIYYYTIIYRYFSLR